MKGEDVGISFITVIVILGAVAVILSITAISIDSDFSKNTASRFEVRYTVLTMQNALKGAEIYMKTGGRYSVYQATYDVFRQGGFEKPGEGLSFNYWYDSFQAVTIPSADGFMESISSLTGEYVNRYASADYNFMRSFQVVIPEYEVSLASNDILNTVNITASSSGRMVLGKTQSTGEWSSIEKPADFTDNLTIGMRELYDRAAGLSISSIVSEIENGMKVISLQDTCPDTYSASTEAEKERIKDAIMAIKLSVPQETSEYSFEISMVHADTKRSPGTPCKHTLLGVAKVNITAKGTSFPVINEDGPNFAPAELIFLIRHAYTSTGDKPTSEELELTPLAEASPTTQNLAIPKPDVPLATESGPTTIYDEIIDEASVRFSIPPVMIKSIIRAESNYNPRAQSNKKGRGLMQLTPIAIEDLGNPKKGASYPHCKSLSIDPDTFYDYDVFIPEKNIMAGTCFFSYFYNVKYINLDPLARFRCSLAAYNAGPTAVEKQGWLQHGCDPAMINFEETRNYVGNITEFAGITTASKSA
jgi:hypothetical protein